ncbi:MAG: hypothetical protein JXA15_02130 [Spirochaetales bacterium]|nr:hypothetical protein [Spirochaetales bacterium]
MKARFVACVALSVIAVAVLPAQELGFSFIGPRLNFTFGFPIPSGADVELSLPVAPTARGPVAAVLALGAGFEDQYFLRDALTGAPVAPADELVYQAANAQWDLGLRVPLLGGQDPRLLEAFAAWRGRYDHRFNDFSTTVFEDARGLFGNALLVGLAYSGSGADSRRVKSGLDAEWSLEWSPAGFSNVEADHLRLNAQARYFMPLFSTGRDDLNLFSAYLASFASVDWAAGTDIPLHVLQSFGGRGLRSGLGGSVRGYASKSYDAATKAVANLELRLLGPAMFELPWFMPLVYGFYDAGFYHGLPESAGQEDADGFIASAGGGFALDLFDFAYAGISAGVLLPGGDALFPVYVPDGETFFFSVEFLLHF